MRKRTADTITDDEIRTLSATAATMLRIECEIALTHRRSGKYQTNLRVHTARQRIADAINARERSNPEPTVDIERTGLKILAHRDAILEIEAMLATAAVKDRDACDEMRTLLRAAAERLTAAEQYIADL